VGVNKFVSSTPRIEGLTRIDPEKESKQKERLARVRQNRDNAQCRKTLAALGEIARSDSNTLPAILQCVEAYASIGEICEVLRKEFGIQKEFLIF
jgi:methylmalonyl-CoA mutase N-terminal domain/subunit